MKYYIFRHAETFPSKTQGGIYDGDNFKTPILYEGKDITVKLANYLKDIESDYNVSSPYERCLETIKIISEITGKEFVIDERVGEFFEKEYLDYRKKIEEFLAEIKQKNYSSVIICTHGATMSQLIHLICDENPEEYIPVSEYESTGILVIVEDKQSLRPNGLKEIKKVNFNY
jgi:broad specificity phosphatase PhoE